MIPNSKISKFIEILLDATKHNQVTWLVAETDAGSSLEGEQKLCGKTYIVHFMDRKFRLFKYTEPVLVDEIELIRKTFYRLEFIDQNYYSLWAFPIATNKLEPLYDAVQIKLSEIDHFFEQIVPDTLE